MIILSKRWSKKWVFHVVWNQRSSRTALIVIIINKARSSCVLLGIRTNVKLRPRSFHGTASGNIIIAFMGDKQSLLRKAFSSKQSHFQNPSPISSTWPINLYLHPRFEGMFVSRCFGRWNTIQTLYWYAIQRVPLENKVGENHVRLEISCLFLHEWQYFNSINDNNSVSQ